MEPLEKGFRSLGTVHDVDDKKHSVIVEFPHEQLDHYNTDFGKDCFRESFKRTLPAMLREHDRNQLIGHAISAEVLPHANRITGQFSDFDSVPLAKQSFAQIRDGDFPGWSFHFTGARAIQHPRSRTGRRFIKADMPEFGPTVFPAIPGTRVVGIRSMGDMDPAWEAQIALDNLGQDMSLMRGNVLVVDRRRSLEDARRGQSRARALSEQICQSISGRR